MRLAITYDVSDDSNRRYVYRTLERYGAWKQYSVFELEISKTERVKLESELESHIDPSDGDRIRLYRLCSACQEATTDIGAEQPEDQSNII